MTSFRPAAGLAALLLVVRASSALPSVAQEPVVQQVELAPAELDGTPDNEPSQAATSAAGVESAAASAVPPPPPPPPLQAVDPEVAPAHARPGTAAQPPPRRAPRLRRIDYEAGMPMPPGGVLRERTRVGLAIGGAGLFLGSYAASVVLATLDDRLDLYFPVFGYFVRAARRGTEGYLRPFLIVGGVAQLAGIGMLVAGILTKQRWVEYYVASNDGRRSVAFSPTVGSSNGLALRVDFIGG